MPISAKIVTMPGPGETLRPELREFLDAVVVPALLRKFVSEIEGAESNPEKSLAPTSCQPAYSDHSACLQNERARRATRRKP
jgi:hypothetical protein